MPNRKEHVDHCKELYGYGFEEIHKWMDGTVKSRGPSHRVDRHDVKSTPDVAFEIFEDKVPEKYRKYIRDAVKDHIELDKRKNRIERVTTKKELFAKEDWTIEDTRGFDRKEIKRVRERKEKYEEWEEEMLKGDRHPPVSPSEEEIQKKRCYLLGKMAECVDKWRKDQSLWYLDQITKRAFYNQLTGERMGLKDIADELRRGHHELEKSTGGDGNKIMSDSGFLDAKWRFSLFLSALIGSDTGWNYENGEMIKQTKEEKKQSECFIATASLGSPIHPHLDHLREFRDEILLNSSLGSSIVHIYYSLSPPIAREISRSSNLRKISKKLIVEPIIQAIQWVKNNRPEP